MVLKTGSEWWRKGWTPPPPPPKAKPATSAKTTSTTPIYDPSTQPSNVWTPPTPSPGGNNTDNWGNSGGGGGDGGYAAAQAAAAAAQAAALAKANQEGKDRSTRENTNTRKLADGQWALLPGLRSQRQAKMDNITAGLKAADKNLLSGYKSTLGSLMGSIGDNDKSTADQTFANIMNGIRERQDSLTQAASLGAGETDLLSAQLGALRNYNANQNEINRSHYDSLRSANSSITSLNSDTATGRRNIYNQSEADREAAWTNWQNQAVDLLTQVQNIENSNNNIDSDSSIAYEKRYTNAAKKAENTLKHNYKRTVHDVNAWGGKGGTQTRNLANTNRAAAVSLSASQKSPEGATLRKW